MKKKGRSRAKTTNLLKIVEAGVLGSILTRNMAGTSLRNFITNENPTDGVTLMELFKGSADITTQTQRPSGGWSFSNSAGLSAGGNLDVVWANTKANAIPLVIGMIGAPILFKFGVKMTSGVRRPVNKLLSGSGVRV